MDFASPNGTHWAVKLPGDAGDEQLRKLEKLAAEHGVSARRCSATLHSVICVSCGSPLCSQCRVIGQIANLPGYFLLEHDPTHRARRRVAEVHSRGHTGES
jgi:hypothetical protein